MSIDPLVRHKHRLGVKIWDTIKNVIKRFLDLSVVAPAGYIFRRVVRVENRLEISDVLRETTARECAAYVSENMQHALEFGHREKLWAHAISKISVTGIVAEFGVWNGYSINYIASRIDQKVYGFDSFEGLKEDWDGSGATKGTFSLGGHLPKVLKNVQLVKGWFDVTLPGFLNEHSENFRFIHVDCDTYEATRTLFEQIADRIIPGTVIVFDEYLGYRGWREGEFKAWQELLVRYGFKSRYVGFCTRQVALVVARD